jgi:phenylpropionate dioxygenase-like ring-hydroxylating dioxygenase large terminal subunit
VLVSQIPALRRYFQPVALSQSIGTAPSRVELFSTGVVLWRPAPDVRVSGAIDECPHRGARLSQGWHADGCVVCPYHGWSFDADGRAVRIPQLDDDTPIPAKARLTPVHVTERYGYVWACLDDEPAAPVPDLPGVDDDGFEMRHEFFEPWAASAPRIVDNSLDIAHVSFVHRGTIGDPAFPKLPSFDVERHAHGLRFQLTYVMKVNDEQKRNLGIDTDHATRDTLVDLVQPLVFTARLRYPNGIEQVLLKGATPIDDQRSMFWQFVARNDAPDDERWASIIGMDRAVTNEDRPILEGVPADFPLSTAAEVHLRADRMTVEYRRLLASL